MALTKGRLQPVAALGSQLHGAIASVFQALWLGQAEPDGDEAIDGMDFETPGFMEASEKTTEDIASGSIPPSPDGGDFVLATRTTDSAPLKLADAPTNP
jgi:hypothetical protein